MPIESDLATRGASRPSPPGTEDPHVTGPPMAASRRWVNAFAELEAIPAAPIELPTLHGNVADTVTAVVARLNLDTPT